MQYHMTAKNLTAGYNGNPVFRNFEIKIPSGKITTLIGANGSGKSTVLKTLARLLVDQDNFLFDMSIRDNIMLGKPDADDKALAASVDAAGCREIVERLEGGLHTVVGTGGALLSTGERQRICIARAILKDAPILLLDEPTASMDLENEYKVQKALQQLMSPKTVVMATHRLRTAVSAQQILVMKHGVLVGKGTHETLLEGCPEYARLWNACVCAENWSMGGDADV